MGIAKSLVIVQWISLGLLVLGVLAQRTQMLPFRVAFGSFALALVVLSITAVVSLVVLGLSFGTVADAARTPSLMAFVIGFIPLLLVISLVGSGFKVPSIHNIATDPSLELQFQHAQTLRKTGENSIEPPSEKVVKLQQGFYKDLEPLHLNVSAARAFELSKTVVDQLGWEITFSDETKGHIEALERTALFGFVDDVLIKILPEGSNVDGGCVVNLRSVSRVGVSDLGANAKRIKKFQAALKDASLK